MSSGNILFQISGSIACYKACDVISKLVQRGFAVEVVMTQSASWFIGEATIEGLTGRRVHRETFEPGQAMEHIRLMRWADLVILCPASANRLNKLAAGIGDDLVGTLFLAHEFDKPFLIAPAMNTSMWNHPATQASLERLRSWGVQILEPGSGALACGEIGDGRLMEPEEILTTILQHFRQAHRNPAPKRVLVTSGGTREQLDGVRSITNFSSGQTGSIIAQSLVDQGHEVTILRAKGSEKPFGVPSEEFVSFQDLETLLKSHLAGEHIDFIVHAAAVGDFHVHSVSDGQGANTLGHGKIQSDGDIKVILKPNPKLVDQLRPWSKNPQLQVIAFKLTNQADSKEQLASVRSLAHRASPNWIVQNDLTRINSTDHLANVYAVISESEIKLVQSTQSKSELADCINMIVEGNEIL